MHQSNLIKIIKDRRESLNVTQEQLADLAEIGLRTLKEFERGKGNPTLLTLQKMANVLGMEIKLEVKRIS